jgi:hypothetical protein
MDKGGAYATLVIPGTLTRSVLLAAGVRTPGATPPGSSAALSSHLLVVERGSRLVSGDASPLCRSTPAATSPNFDRCLRSSCSKPAPV